EAEIEGIRFKFTESDAVYEQAENIGRVFKTTAEINNFIRETEKPEDPALYYKTDVVVTLTDGTSFTGTIDIGTKSLAHFGDGNYIEQLVRENRTSAVALLEDYHDSNNLNSTEQNAIEYQKRIETGDRILKAIAAELPVQINQEIKTPTVTVANTGAKPTNESNTRTNGLGNNSAVNSGTSRIQPSLFESANNADGFHAGYDAGNTDVSANERQSGRSNGKTEGNQSAAAVSPINAGQTGINHAQATGNVSGSDQGKSATGVIENAPVEIITADSLGIGKNTEKRERIDNLGVVEYKPAKLTKGMKHPADIVESASMAAVVTPDITYTPRLDRQIIDKGLLSSLQLETVIYTGQRHELRLGDGNRAGFFIGDGTGVGKGRELAGIALDNWNQGRQRILWLSINYDLVPSTERDMKGLGASDVPFHTLNKHTVHADLEESIGDGLLFASYSTLTGKGKDGATRFDQIVKWLGEDGVIMFDEGHLAKNAVSFGMSQASQRGEAVVDLQIGDKSNPNWRIVYSSATGATELRNMA
ncbi:MAG TPA: strawberry notch family protein, partial [Pyrinomonadaceae bacterium]|nr:strawberry notch family protein [Pyrinomonadaceae bacterium]